MTINLLVPLPIAHPAPEQLALGGIPEAFADYSGYAVRTDRPCRRMLTDDAAVEEPSRK